MELKLLALQLGLPETATEADVNQALNDLKAAFYDHGKIMINAVPSLCSPIHL